MVKNTEKTKFVLVQLTPEQSSSLDKEAEKMSGSRSQVMRMAFIRFLEAEQQ